MTHSAEVITPSWSWLRATSRSLYQLDASHPQPAAHFPWEKLQEALQKHFKLDDFSLEKEECRWLEKGKSTSGLDGKIKTMAIQATGLDGELSLLFSETANEALMARLLQLDSSVVHTLPKEFLQSFYLFIMAEALFQMNLIGFEKLTFSMHEGEALASEPALAQDFFIHIGPMKFLTRLLMSADFQASLQQKITYAPQRPRLEDVPVVLHLEAGRSFVTLDQLTAVRPGDFLTMDQSWSDPEQEIQNCLVTVSGRPLFSADFQDQQMVIKEIPSHYEVNNIMPEKVNIKNSSHDEAPSLEEEPIDEGQEFGHELDENEDDVDEYELQDASPQKEEEAAHEEEVPRAKKAAKPKAAKPKAIEPQAAQLGTGQLTMNDIHVTVAVELAQVELSAQKLLELQPGSMLDVHSDGSSVLLTVNGKIIGKGEIIKIGSTLGVRILELGPQQ